MIITTPPVPSRCGPNNPNDSSRVGEGATDGAERWRRNGHKKVKPAHKQRGTDASGALLAIYTYRGPPPPANHRVSSWPPTSPALLQRRYLRHGEAAPTQITHETPRAHPPPHSTNRGEPAPRPNGHNSADSAPLPQRWLPPALSPPLRTLRPCEKPKPHPATNRPLRDRRQNSYAHRTSRHTHKPLSRSTRLTSFTTAGGPSPQPPPPGSPRLAASPQPSQAPPSAGPTSQSQPPRPPAPSPAGCVPSH